MRRITSINTEIEKIQEQIGQQNAQWDNASKIQEQAGVIEGMKKEVSEIKIAHEHLFELVKRLKSEALPKVGT